MLDTKIAIFAGLAAFAIFAGARSRSKPCLIQRSRRRSRSNPCLIQRSRSSPALAAAPSQLEAKIARIDPSDPSRVPTDHPSTQPPGPSGAEALATQGRVGTPRLSRPRAVPARRVTPCLSSACFLRSESHNIPGTKKRLVARPTRLPEAGGAAAGPASRRYSQALQLLASLGVPAPPTTLGSRRCQAPPHRPPRLFAEAAAPAERLRPRAAAGPSLSAAALSLLSLLAGAGALEPSAARRQIVSVFCVLCASSRRSSHRRAERGWCISRRIISNAAQRRALPKVTASPTWPSSRPASQHLPFAQGAYQQPLGA
jgi:hypothetical protein